MYFFFLFCPLNPSYPLPIWYLFFLPLMLFYCLFSVFFKSIPFTKFKLPPLLFNSHFISLHHVSLVYPLQHLPAQCLCFQPESFLLCWEDGPSLPYLTNWEEIYLVISRWRVSALPLRALGSVRSAALPAAWRVSTPRQITGTVSWKRWAESGRCWLRSPRAAASSLRRGIVFQSFSIFRISGLWTALGRNCVSFCWLIRMGPKLQLGLWSCCKTASLVGKAQIAGLLKLVKSPNFLGVVLWSSVCGVVEQMRRRSLLPV